MLTDYTPMTPLTSVRLTAIDANWCHKNGAQGIPSILAEEASIDLKPLLLIVLYPLYYLELSS